MGRTKRKFFRILSTCLVALMASMCVAQSAMDGGQSPLLFSQPRFSSAALTDAETPGPDVPGRFVPSKAGAFLFSLILPGSGEYYAGSRKMAAIFLGSEAMLWSVFFAFRTYGNWKEDDYQKLAVAHAGVDAWGKDYDYYIAVENYDTIYEYNQAKLKERNLRDMYPEDEAHHWDWDSETSRKRFKELRIASDGAFRNAIYVVGVIVVNHIVSGIDALRLARKAEGSGEQSVRLGVSPLREGGLSVVLCKSF